MYTGRMSRYPRRPEGRHIVVRDVQVGNDIDHAVKVSDEAVPDKRRTRLDAHHNVKQLYTQPIYSSD